MDYHIFRKPKKLKNKTVHRWYYYYNDPITGKKIQINDQWRICFRWEGTDAFDVEIVDYHS